MEYSLTIWYVSGLHTENTILKNSKRGFLISLRKRIMVDDLVENVNEITTTIMTVVLKILSDGMWKRQIL